MMIDKYFKVYQEYLRALTYLPITIQIESGVQCDWCILPDHAAPKY